MKVSLIYYTGMGMADPLFAARLLAYIKNTRLEQGVASRMTYSLMPEDELMKELDYVARTIRSSWEMVDYTLEIKDVTRAFTHQLVRTRTGSYAQQSQRSVDMGGFTTEVPVTVKQADGGEMWSHCMDMVADTYEHYRQLGIPAQDARGVLPTNVHTNIIAKFNLRTMADLVGKRENLRAQGEYADVVRLMKAEILKVHPWASLFLNPERTKTPALEKLLKENLGDRTPVSVPEINSALKELDTLKGTWG